MVEMAEIHRNQYSNELKCIPLSAKSVGGCIENIAKDLKKHVLEQIT